MSSNKTIMLLSFEEARDYLGLTTSHLRSLVFKKSIPYIKVGAKLKFNKLTLNNWLERYSIDDEVDVIEPPKERLGAPVFKIEERKLLDIQKALTGAVEKSKQWESKYYRVADKIFDMEKRMKEMERTIMSYRAKEYLKELIYA